MSGSFRERFRHFVHHLRSLQRPLVQEADLAVCFLLALRDAGDLTEQTNPPELPKTFNRFRDALTEFGALESFREGGHIHGYLIGASAIPEAEEAFCSLDPFGYVSHLSAMTWHGLSDRVPKTLFVTRPSLQLWKQLSDRRLQRDLGDLYRLHQDAGFPGYRRVAIQKLNRRPLNIWSSSRLNKAYQAAYKKASEGRIRLATVGRCFLDMVREPELCGGIYHVMELFEEHGGHYIEQILVEIDRHGNKMERARAGYLLEQANPELTEHPVLERWAAGVTRGGSRKLDPASDYAERYSERWAMSINV